jgi:hypothetical protein
MTMRHFLPAALLAALALPTAAATAGTPVVRKMTCPIGGKAFDFATTGSYSTAGARPDGKPYGSWTFPLALPECPDNGLVLYKEYEPAEVEKLAPLVASDAYQALRREDTPYYRAYWLMREMGLGPESYLWALLQASWEADSKPALKARYQAELAEASAKVAADPASLNWLGMEGRAINALRELGRFDEAQARLARLPAAGLAPVAGEAADQARARKAWGDFLAGQRKAIARKDASSEPLDLIPRREALSRCLAAAAPAGEHDRAFCTAEDKAVEALRAARAKLDADAKAVAESRDKGGR